MVDTPRQDWDPTAPEIADDPLGGCDAMRERCPVAHDSAGGWTLFRHADVERVLHDPESFSNVVSRHLSMPNGMDPPEHTVFRAMVEPYLSTERVTQFEPTFRRIARDCVTPLGGERRVELMATLAGPFAAKAQCVFLGWPESMAEPLREWTTRNHRAIRAQDRDTLAALAREFEGYVEEMVSARRDAGAPQDVTAELLAERVEGRPLRFEELASLFRNWTVGEVGTLAAAVGILAHHLAVNPSLQRQLRGDHQQLPAAIEEILRVDGPLVANRRRTTRAVELGGREIPAGSRISLHWIAANRDERAFTDAREIDPQRPQERNLLYGDGIHVCPGAALARMELHVVMESLLEATEWLAPDPDRPASRAVYPAAGFDALPLQLQ